LQWFALINIFAGFYIAGYQGIGLAKIPQFKVCVPTQQKIHSFAA